MKLSPFTYPSIGTEAGYSETPTRTPDMRDSNKRYCILLCFNLYYLFHLNLPNNISLDQCFFFFFSNPGGGGGGLGG